MTSWTVLVKNSAKSDLRKLRESHLRGRFEELVTALRADPFNPTDNMKKLQPYSSGLYSRRINHQHRLIYQVDSTRRQVIIYSAWSHYNHAL